MTVLTRDLLTSSPLADLHALASELAIDGFRRLRREELIDRISERRSGDAGDADERPAGRRRRRGGRGGDADATPENGGRGERQGDDREGDERPSRRRRRGGDESSAAPSDNGRDRDRGRDRGDRDRNDRDRNEQGENVEGAIAIGASGSALLTTGDGAEVYVSAGQVRRCELVDGDRVSGPTRPARNSERYASLIRVESINGRSADEVAPGPKPEVQTAVRPHELLAIESDDPTVAAIAWLTPLGRGSRAVIAGPHASGKSEALRRLGAALKGIDDVELLTVLAGVRPEELGDWRDAGLTPTVELDLSAGPDQRAKAIDEAVDQGRRIAGRGGHAVVLIDTLDGLPEGAARRILAAARKLQAGGSLTIIATREAPVGGESTVVRLDHALTSTDRFPSLDLANSGTLRPELLVGDEGAKAIAKARAELR
ncbi:MAG: Rho termination factor N-terminal domain-containing protein [Patulibacter sp.]|nr:Rho termination factor N-terminal domain-containing protein [Patulibacter sp.]